MVAVVARIKVLLQGSLMTSVLLVLRLLIPPVSLLSLWVSTQQLGAVQQLPASCHC
jgi:hypothetical protein